LREPFEHLPEKNPERVGNRALLEIEVPGGALHSTDEESDVLELAQLILNLIQRNAIGPRDLRCIAPAIVLQVHQYSVGRLAAEQDDQRTF